LFEDFYRIYAESISVREQKSRAQIAAMVLRPDYKILLAKRSGRVIGFSMLFLPAKEPFCLLEYLAVETMQRNTGVGTSLFRHSLQVAALIHVEVSLLLEVDSESGSSPDQAIRRRRQQFYRRLGCRRIDGISYLLPLPAEGPPPKMDLMVYLSPAVSSIPKSTLEHWLKVVYQQVYGCSSDDIRITRMMAGVVDPIRLV
jgi:N-acetylglutamate synthase-like GNAT family acetyltransferase